MKNVHEGPIGIGTRVQYTEVALSAGNVISDEPGYYEDGNFGIRIESLSLFFSFYSNDMLTNHRYHHGPRSPTHALLWRETLAGIRTRDHDADVSAVDR